MVQMENLFESIVSFCSTHLCGHCFHVLTKQDTLDDARDA